MFRSLLISALLLTSISIQAQQKLLNTAHQNTGSNYRTNSEVVAKTYILPERIHTFHIDSTTNTATLQLRDLTKNAKNLKSKGSIALVDLGTNTIKWNRPFDYASNGFAQYGKHYIQSSPGKSIIINAENGTDAWIMPNEIYYVHPVQHIALGYKYRSLANVASDRLEGIDISNGKVLWKREIKKDYSWNEIKNLDDSTLLIVSSGLHTINLNDGTGWDYDASTGRNDYRKMIAANAAGIALGVLTGTYMMSTGSDIVKDLVSNLLIDDSAYYLASRHEIVKIDSTGNKRWQKPLAKEFASKSELFLKRNDLIMVNRGYAYYNDNLVDYGMPFIAVFDKSNGNQKYLVETGRKKQMINSYMLNKDSSEIFLVMDNKLSRYSLNDGKLIHEQPFDGKKYDKPGYLMSDNAYVKQQADLEPIATHFKDQHILFTKKDKVLLLDNALNVTYEVDSKDLYFTFATNKNYSLLIRDHDVLIVDAQHKVLGELKISPDAKIVNNKVYDVQDNKLLEIDLQEFAPAM